jgi:hypothetical protein
VPVPVPVPVPELLRNTREGGLAIRKCSSSLVRLQATRDVQVGSPHLFLPVFWPT